MHALSCACIVCCCVLQARAAILDFRLLHNVSSQVMTANRYDRISSGAGSVFDHTQWPFHTFDRIAFWQKTAERG